MSERKYTSEQKEIYKKIDIVLKQYQTLKIDLPTNDLYKFEDINDNENEAISESEAKDYMRKVFRAHKACLSHSKILAVLKEKLEHQNEMIKVICNLENNYDNNLISKLNALNVNCCQISSMIAYCTKSNIIAQLTKQAANCVMTREKDQRIVCAFILHYVVGLDLIETGGIFPGEELDSFISSRTIKRWMMQAIIDDLSSEIQAKILTQYRE